MKTFGYLIILSVVFLTSCKQSIKTNPADQILGEWVVVSATGSFEEMNIGTKYTFSSTKMTTEKGINVSGEMQLTDSTIAWYPSGMELKYDYHFVNDVLIVQPVNSDQILKLKHF
ncbi:MAG: hypothetical protein U9N51_09465 [Bacteroidota bacterium]|nr:hypothetical protein [Bacteroidota bacterium]